MRTFMHGPALILALAAPLAAASAQTPADPSWQPVYNIYYYSDASYSQQVGASYGYCTYFGPSGTAVDGETTEFSESVQVAWCDENGVDQPI